MPKILLQLKGRLKNSKVCLSFFLALIAVNITPLLAKDLSAKNNKTAKVTLVLEWAPNTNHTGIVVAKDKGYYKNLGIEVTIIEAGKSSSPQLVARGLATFAISTAEEVVLAASHNIPVISIAAINAHNLSGFYSLQNKGIKRPRDFENKVYGGWGGAVELATVKNLIAKDGGNPEKVKFITIGDIDFFKIKGVDFAWGFQGWLGIYAKLHNLAVNFLPLVKYRGVDDYSPVIITSKNLINTNPRLVEDFVQATKKGYNFAARHPKQAATILLHNYPELNPSLVAASQKFLAGKYKDDSPYWGYQNQKTWQRYINWLYQNHIISTPLAATKVFTNQFFAVNNNSKN